MRSTPVRISHLLLFVMGVVLLVYLGTFPWKVLRRKRSVRMSFRSTILRRRIGSLKERSPYDPLNGLQVSTSQTEDPDRLNNH